MAVERSWLHKYLGSVVEQRKNPNPAPDVAASNQGTNRDPGSSSGQSLVLDSGGETLVTVDDNDVGNANSMEVDEESSGGKFKGYLMFRGWY